MDVDDSSNDLVIEEQNVEPIVCDERPENLSETCQTLPNKDQSALSDSFCDEIFGELEKTATFHKFTDWSSSNDKKVENLCQDFHETKEKDSR